MFIGALIYMAIGALLVFICRKELLKKVLEDPRITITELAIVMILTWPRCVFYGLLNVYKSWKKYKDHYDI